ncbi:hypothetical protein K458DRAFT_390473 [Lentithecium fluviatile CBS 122367]|uniref:DNA-directed RNA polymerase III subunit RPC9 n=1 Tax=Lentithecium fluviatile CBS 122367 TaxID=1168545 RepID=A0A6G1IZ10_9PLEO|nr:hypothetical protein K458DRAFT_390473 [Lentithecium fluviatile CBS 122367]
MTFQSTNSPLYQKTKTTTPRTSRTLSFNSTNQPSTLSLFNLYFTTMRIKHPQSALLTNHEVLLHLQEEQEEEYGMDRSGRMRRMPKDLEEVVRDGITYLTKPDYFADHNLTVTHPTRPMTLYKGPHSLLRALAPKYRLNKAEYLQIYNIRPKSQITLQLVIEEATSRFSEAELDDMLQIITQVLHEEHEEDIPEGVEDIDMEKLDSKLLGATKKGRKVKRKT